MDNCTTYCIYRIVCFPTAKVYVGLTNNLSRRRREHFRELKLQTHCNEKLQRAYNKYGINAFYFEVLEKNVTPNHVDEREKHWIAFFDSHNNGFNCTPGGDIVDHQGKPCTWNGIEYPTIAAAARVIGIHPSSMALRLKKGRANDRDMLPKSFDKRTPCQWNGINYPSMSEAAKANGVELDTMYHRMKMGYISDQDMIRMHSHTCTWNGIEYSSVSAAARANKITKPSMNSRIKKGYCCDADMPRSSEPIKCTWNGIGYPTINAAAKANGITLQAMRCRLLRGYTCDDDIQKQYSHIGKRKT